MIDLECLVGPTVVVLPEEIDVINARSVGEQLVAAIVPGVTVVVADLSMTTFCNCAGSTVCCWLTARLVRVMPSCGW